MQMPLPTLVNHLSRIQSVTKSRPKNNPKTHLFIIRETSKRSQKTNKQTKMDFPRKRKILTETLINAECSEEMLAVFKEMEKSPSLLFNEDDLDNFCMTIANQLRFEGCQDLEKLLSFAKRGLRYIFSQTGGQISPIKKPCINENDYTVFFHHGMDLMTPHFLNMLGSICFELRRFGESLSYYNWAERNLVKLVEKDCPSKCFLKKMEKTNLGLYDLKREMGKVQEAASHMKKILECKEKRLEEGCVELGKAYKDVYEAYYFANDLKQVLPFCLKALEIHVEHFGNESVEVAEMISSLGTIYKGLGEIEKAHEQKMLAKSILEKVAPDCSDMLNTQIGVGHTLVQMGKFGEAIDVLKAVASHTDASGLDRARAYTDMANASFSLGKMDDTKKYMKTARGIYEKEEMEPIFAAMGLEDLSKMYEFMNDLKTSILLARKAIKVPKIPREVLMEATTRLFNLYSLAGNVDEGIPHMEDAVEKLKESYGPETRELGYGYLLMGEVYMNYGQEGLAVKVLENAKEILDVSLGPEHMDSLDTSHMLSVTCSRLRRMERAIEVEEKVIEGCKVLGSRGEELLGRAVEHMKKMKEMMVSPEWAVAELLGAKLRFGI